MVADVAAKLSWAEIRQMAQERDLSVHQALRHYIKSQGNLAWLPRNRVRDREFFPGDGDNMRNFLHGRFKVVPDVPFTAEQARTAMKEREWNGEVLNRLVFYNIQPSDESQRRHFYKKVSGWLSGEIPMSRTARHRLAQAFNQHQPLTYRQFLGIQTKGGWTDQEFEFLLNEELRRIEYYSKSGHCILHQPLNPEVMDDYVAGNRPLGPWIKIAAQSLLRKLQASPAQIVIDREKLKYYFSARRSWKRAAVRFENARKSIARRKTRRNSYTKGAPSYGGLAMWPKATDVSEALKADYASRSDRDLGDIIGQYVKALRSGVNDETVPSSAAYATAVTVMTERYSAEARTWFQLYEDRFPADRPDLNEELANTCLLKAAAAFDSSKGKSFRFFYYIVWRNAAVDLMRRHKHLEKIHIAENNCSVPVVPTIRVAGPVRSIDQWLPLANSKRKRKIRIRDVVAAPTIVSLFNELEGPSPPSKQECTLVALDLAIDRVIARLPNTAGEAILMAKQPAIELKSKVISAIHAAREKDAALKPAAVRVAVVANRAQKLSR